MASSLTRAELPRLVPLFDVVAEGGDRISLEYRKALMDGETALGG